MRNIMVVLLLLVTFVAATSTSNAGGTLLEGPACVWVPGPFGLIWNCN
jgi:hypothetical protein